MANSIPVHRIAPIDAAKPHDPDAPAYTASDADEADLVEWLDAIHGGRTFSDEGAF